MENINASQKRVRPENWVEVVTEHECDCTSGNPALYVGTYYKYNCGSLCGMWVDLTSFLDYDDFMEFCHLLHIDEEDPEFMYQDYENFSSEWYSESCFDEVAFDKILEYGNMDEEDRNMFDAFTEHYGSGYTLEDAKEHFQGGGIAKRNLPNTSLMIVTAICLNSPVAILTSSVLHAICLPTITHSAMDMCFPIIKECTLSGGHIYTQRSSFDCISIH